MPKNKRIKPPRNQIENMVLVNPVIVILPTALAMTLYIAMIKEIVEIVNPIFMAIFSGLLLFDIIMSDARFINLFSE